jgi:hypothetical protein
MVGQIMNALYDPGAMALVHKDHRPDMPTHANVTCDAQAWLPLSYNHLMPKRSLQIEVVFTQIPNSD